MEGDFASNLDNPEPHVNYVVNGVTGALTVEQHDTFSGGFIPFRKRCRKPITEWNIGLNNNVPIDLNINTGTGRLDLGLKELSLLKLDVGLSVGELDANLNGSTVSDVELELGSGNATLDLSNTQSLERVDLSLSVGGLEANLTGDRSVDLNANIDVGSGNIFLKLPTDIGVEVKIPDSTSVTVVHEMNENDDKTLTNDAFGSSNVTIFVDIELSVGKVTLELN